ncbi:MAG: electron transfer flavoprotein subunit alpha/FixB family protein [Solirubrobacteraceae bacterium]
MSTLVFLEAPGDELSQQAMRFARQLGDDVAAVAVGGDAPYAPATWGQAIADTASQRGARAVVAPGTERGNEVLAHAAAILDQPFAANCTAVAPGEPVSVTRVRWGGSLLEEANLHGSPLLMSVAPHAVAADTTALNGNVEMLSVEASDAVRVLERVSTVTEGVTLTDAKVVVSGGRGVGSAEGFGPLEELAELLHGAVGCSRAVTSAGWRPHTDQVGQTGTKVAPDIYIACGISGATQHMAGCKGAKKLLAINPDAEASIFANADYAVIGDLHEVVPAISAEIRKARGT